MIFAYHPVLISSDIKYHPVTSIAKQIGRTKGFRNISRSIQSAIFKSVNQILKELRLFALSKAKSSIDFLLISLTFINTDVNIPKVHKK